MCEIEGEKVSENVVDRKDFEVSAGALTRFGSLVKNDSVPSVGDVVRLFGDRMVYLSIVQRLGWNLYRLGNSAYLVLS